MLPRLRLRKTRRRLTSDSKGFSSIVGAVFAVLVMMSLISTVFVWSLSQNTLYNNTVTQTRQADLDRSNEKIVANITVSRVDSNNVAVDGNLSNEGPLSVQIVTLWVLDANTTYALKSLNITLKPGNVTTLSGPTYNVPLANSSGDSLSCWFISGRGNTISKNPLFGVNTGSGGPPPFALVSGGIGSISMDFAAFRSYIVNSSDYLGPARASFTISQNENLAFSINVTNLDPSQRNINLTSNSCFWALTPPKGAGTPQIYGWYIATVTNGRISNLGSGAFVTLPYNQTAKIFFGTGKTGNNLNTGPAAVNLLLTGTLYNSTSTSDYGQNLPFIALTVAS